MLVITNGINTLTVSKGAYKTLYAHQGYTVISGEGASAPSTLDDSQMSRMPQEEREEPEVDETLSGPENGSAGLSGAESGISSTTHEEDEEEDEEEDLSEIPISAMSMSQLKAYAIKIGVKLDGTETKRELRQLIRENM